MTSAQYQDLILKHCLKTPKKTISTQELKNELFADVEIKLAIINDLVEQIDLMSNGKIARVIKSERFHFIASNDLTETFLNQGGFSKYEQEEAEQKRIQEERDNIAFEKSKIDLELAKKMLKEYPKTKWFARIGFIIGTGLALLKLAEYLGFLQPPN